MSQSPRPNLTPPQLWGVRICRWLWAQRGFIWGTLIAGVLVSVVSTWLTSQSSSFVGTPVGIAMMWVRDHLLLAGVIGVCLLLFALLVGAFSQWPDVSPYSLPTTAELQQKRQDLVRSLTFEYHRQLTQPLQSATRLELMLKERIGAVSSPSQLISWPTHTLDAHTTPITSIIEAYDQAHEGFLLLGAAGAGKSTLLRELACGLLTRAEQNAAEPIPVIVNLSSWAITDLSLEDWLSDQLSLVYALPLRLSKTWMKQDQLLFLLDGLDEVGVPARTRCIQAINAYRREHFVPLVVCSRRHEYLEQEERLVLPIAVEIQPLTFEEVDGYLKQIGKPLAGVRAALQSNTIRHDLVTTPLMLSIMIRTYQGKTAKDLSHLGSREEQQRRVLEDYVTQMLGQPTRTWYYDSSLTKKGLVWLAQQLQQHRLTEFYLEYLQYSWLPTKRVQVLSRCFGGLAFGLLIGLLGGLIFGPLGWLVGSLVGGPLVGLQTGPVGGLVFGLLIGLQIGLVFGLVYGLLGGLGAKSGGSPSDVLTWSWKRFWPGLVIGLAVGLAIGLVFELVFGLPIELVFGLLYGLLGGLLGGLEAKSAGSPSDMLTWSWKRFWPGLVRGLIIGLLGGLVFGLSIGLVVGLFYGLAYGLLGGLLGGLVSGLSSASLNEPIRTKPNQGIDNSGRNAIRTGLLYGLLYGLSFGLVFGLVFGLAGGVLVGLSFALSFGPPIGLAVGLSFGLLFGGRVYLAHYHLRYMLWQSGVMPLNAVGFLNEAVERALLKPVGGGYGFIHPLFQEYFASLDSAASPIAVQHLPPSP